eukprot:5308932-Prymnesium_polylepis.1
MAGANGRSEWQERMAGVGAEAEPERVTRAEFARCGLLARRCSSMASAARPSSKSVRIATNSRGIRHRSGRSGVQLSEGADRPVGRCETACSVRRKVDEKGGRGTAGQRATSAGAAAG